MKTFAILFLMIFTSASSFARGRAELAMRGGTEVGNGTFEFAEDHGAAWFLGRNRTIRACVRMAPDFGIDRATAVNAITEAFGKWPEYMKEKRIYEGSAAMRDDRLPTSRLVISDRECSGGEDLQFLLGGALPRIASPAELTVHPVALAKKTAYDAAAGWGRGIVWVKSSERPVSGRSFPNWKLAYQLKMILLHEMGHIFGCSHINDTAMAEDFSSYVRVLYRDTWSSDGMEASFKPDFAIDRMRELVSCKNCLMRARQADFAPSAAGFEIVAGYRPVGPVSCTVDDYVGTNTKFTMICKTSRKTHRWTLEAFEMTQDNSEYRPQFKIYKRGSSELSVNDDYGESWIGALAADDGKQFNITFSRIGGEFDFNRFDVSVLIHGKKHLLFGGGWEAVK